MAAAYQQNCRETERLLHDFYLQHVADSMPSYASRRRRKIGGAAAPTPSSRSRSRSQSRSENKSRSRQPRSRSRSGSKRSVSTSKKQQTLTLSDAKSKIYRIMVLWGIPNPTKNKLDAFKRTVAEFVNQLVAILDKIKETAYIMLGDDVTSSIAAKVDKLKTYANSYVIKPLQQRGEMVANWGSEQWSNLKKFGSRFQLKSYLLVVVAAGIMVAAYSACPKNNEKIEALSVNLAHMSAKEDMFRNSVATFCENNVPYLGAKVATIIRGFMPTASIIKMIETVCGMKMQDKIGKKKQQAQFDKTVTDMLNNLNSKIWRARSGGWSFDLSKANLASISELAQFDDVVNLKDFFFLENLTPVIICAIEQNKFLQQSLLLTLDFMKNHSDYERFAPYYYQLNRFIETEPTNIWEDLKSFLNKNETLYADMRRVSTLENVDIYEERKPRERTVVYRRVTQTIQKYTDPNAEWENTAEEDRDIIYVKKLIGIKNPKNKISMKKDGFHNPIILFDNKQKGNFSVTLLDRYDKDIETIIEEYKSKTNSYLDKLKKTIQRIQPHDKEMLEALEKEVRSIYDLDELQKDDILRTTDRVIVLADYPTKDHDKQSIVGYLEQKFKTLANN